MYNYILLYYNNYIVIIYNSLCNKKEGASDFLSVIMCEGPGRHFEDARVRSLMS